MIGVDRGFIQHRQLLGISWRFVRDCRYAVGVTADMLAMRVESPGNPHHNIENKRRTFRGAAPGELRLVDVNEWSCTTNLGCKWSQEAVFRRQPEFCRASISQIPDSTHGVSTHCIGYRNQLAACQFGSKHASHNDSGDTAFYAGSLRLARKI